MQRKYIASIIYNIVFFMLSLITCLTYWPALFFPRQVLMRMIRFYLRLNYFLERTILGLKYKIRGLEHLPKSGPYIIAAKHQSEYETLKLHLLFPDPAIILKKELFKIPLWGYYLKKSDVIAIDRSTPETAIESINSGAKRVKAQGRPILIFPQGTRVGVDISANKKPYKNGIARIQEATNLPIIPMAINAGMFWPRNAFWKSGGTAIFQFLPPIEPGLERSELLKKLENTIEPASKALMKEALEKARQQP
ncbi:MAG: lysophospholipid acyltransferase family protein [Alphaproteobacteria bacterium]